MTRKNLITALVDCIGYQESDFEDMTKQEIIDYAGEDEMNEIKGY